jgi:methionine-rich copper-binding protein CopC
LNKFTYFVRILTLGSALLMAGLVIGPVPGWAHAIIVSAQPAAGASVSGPDVDLAFTFNVRVDPQRSKLTLTGPDGSNSDIVIVANDSPAVLAGHLTGLKPGSYSVRWQVLATDGHITRGDVAFTVLP